MSRELNIKVVHDFFDTLVIKKDFELARQFIAPNYIEHSIEASDGLEGLKNDVIGYLKVYPMSTAEIKRTVADGDMVILHVHTVLEPGTPGRAVMESFRLENGKVVEHWDISEDIPTKLKHNNGVF